MILYRFRIFNLHHLALLKKLKILENFSGIQGSVTIVCSSKVDRGVSLFSGILMIEIGNIKERLDQIKTAIRTVR